MTDKKQTIMGDRIEAMRMAEPPNHKFKIGMAAVSLLVIGWLVVPYAIEAIPATAQNSFIETSEDMLVAQGSGDLSAGFPREYEDPEIAALKEAIAALTAQNERMQRDLDAANARPTGLPDEVKAQMEQMASTSQRLEEALTTARDELDQTRDATAQERRRQSAEIARLQNQLNEQRRQMAALGNRPAEVPSGDPNALELARMQMDERLRYAELDAEREQRAMELQITRQSSDEEFRRDMERRREEARLRRQELAESHANELRLKQFDADEASRLAAIAAAEAEAADLEARYATSSVVHDIGGAGQGAAGASSGTIGTTLLAGLDDSAFSTGTEFFDNANDRGYTTATSTQLSDPSSLITQGTSIPASLETAVSSDQPGILRASVSRDVYSRDGSRVLLPAGTTLIGEYSSQVEVGQRRILAAWTRAITPDHRSIQLGSIGTDALGRSGMTGQVEARLPEKFEAAFLISIFSGIGGLGSEALRESVVEDSASSGVNAATAGAGGVFNEYLNIPPSIYVDQGQAINVLVNRDLRFPE